VLIRPSTLSFNAAEVALLSAIAGHLGGAIQRDRLRRRAEQAAVVEERQRLARDLHDSIAQSLYSVSLFAQAGWDSVNQKSWRQSKHYLKRLGETARQALKEMRLMIFELHEEMNPDGLVSALESGWKLSSGARGWNVKSARTTCAICPWLSRPSCIVLLRKH